MGQCRRRDAHPEHTHQPTRNNHRCEYDEDDGVIRDKSTDETIIIYQAGGVYFAPLLVKRDIAVGFTQGFGRPGP